MDLRIKDVAELLSVSETTIRRWLADGKIPAYRLRRQYRFNRTEIENWMMHCRLEHKKGGFLPKDVVGDSAVKSKRAKKPFAGHQQFSFYRALHHGTVMRDVQGTTKEAIVSQIMDAMADGLSLDAHVVADLLIDRESLMPTALNNGIAVPHTRDLVFEGPHGIIGVAMLRSPIDWGALDDKPVHTLFFLFASDDKQHLHLLAKIAHLSSDEKALKFLQKQPDRQSLLAYIKQWELGLKGSGNRSCFSH